MVQLKHFSLPNMPMTCFLLGVIVTFAYFDGTVSMKKEKKLELVTLNFEALFLVNPFLLFICSSHLKKGESILHSGFPY